MTFAFAALFLVLEMIEDRTALLFPRGGVAEVPFQFEPELPRCIASGPGGHPLHVLLDTGTDPSAIDARLARRLALRTGGSGMGQGAVSDRVAFTEAVLPWLRLGSPDAQLTIRDLFAPAIDLSDFPFPVDVVLGYNVLRQLTLRFEYWRQTLILAHPDLGLPANGTTLPLTFFEHFPAISDLEVDGVRIPLATLDTGSNAALTVGPHLAARIGLLEGARGVSAGHGAGFGGSTPVLRRSCGRLRIGDFVLEDVEIDTQIGDAGDLSRAERANIGNRLLARFAAVSIDYGRALLVLQQQ